MLSKVHKWMTGGGKPTFADTSNPVQISFCEGLCCVFYTVSWVGYATVHEFYGWSIMTVH